jgi:hypothetical protein
VSNRDPGEPTAFSPAALLIITSAPPNTMPCVSAAGSWLTINTYGYTDVRLPWGGTRDSGFGREHGTAAIDNFTEPKAVGARRSVRSSGGERAQRRPSAADDLQREGADLPAGRADAVETGGDLQEANPGIEEDVVDGLGHVDRLVQPD